METISRKDLTAAWLAGMIDADGCIGFARMLQNRRQRKTEHLNIYTAITTTCTLTMEHLRRVYEELEVAYHVAIKDNGGADRKPVYIIKVHGMMRNEKLLPLITPYLVTKKKEAELMLEFISIRLKLRNKKTHDPREDAIAREVKELKATRNTVKYPQRLYARLR